MTFLRAAMLILSVNFVAVAARAQSDQTLDYVRCEALLDLANYPEEVRHLGQIRVDQRTGSSVRGRADILTPQLESEALHLWQMLIERIAERDIELVLMISPPPALAFGPESYERLRPTLRYEYAVLRESFENHLEVLRNLNVQVPDILSKIDRSNTGQTYFLDRDPHWSPAGAQLAASAIAERYRDNWPKAERVSVPYSYGTERDVYFEQIFDPIMETVCGISLPETYLPVPDRDLDETSQNFGDALFGDAPSENRSVVLAGTSFSWYSSQGDRSGFADALAVELQADVMNWAVPGADLHRSMALVLAAIANGDIAPDLIVWEMPERVIWGDLDGLRQLVGLAGSRCAVERPVLRDLGTEWIEIPLHDPAVDRIDVELLGMTAGTLELELIFSASSRIQVIENTPRSRVELRGNIWSAYLDPPANETLQSVRLRLERINGAPPIFARIRSCAQTPT